MPYCAGADDAEAAADLDTADDGLDTDDPGLNALARRLAAHDLHSDGVNGQAAAAAAVAEPAGDEHQTDTAARQTEMQTLQVSQ